MAQTFTRRALGALLAFLPAAAIARVTPAPVAAPASSSLDDFAFPFAVVWLSRWTANGGTVTIDHADPEKAWFGIPEFSFSRGWERETYERLRDVRHDLDWFKARSEDDRRNLDADHRRQHDDRYHGRMRELNDLLDAVNGGLAAVKAVVREYPHLGLRPLPGLLEKGGAE